MTPSETPRDLPRSEQPEPKDVSGEKLFVRAPVPKERVNEEKKKAEWEKTKKDMLEKVSGHRKGVVYKFSSEPIVRNEIKDADTQRKFDDAVDFITGSTDHPNNGNVRITDVHILVLLEEETDDPAKRGEPAVAAFDKNGKLIGYAD